MSNDKPGMETVRRFIGDGEVQSQEAICYAIANEIWVHISALYEDSKKPVSKRMVAAGRNSHLTEMRGLKVALRLALGITRVPEESNVDAFLNRFQQERLNATGESE